VLELRNQVLKPHAIENLAPVQDQLAFEHPSGGMAVLPVRLQGVCCMEWQASALAAPRAEGREWLASG
jgi:hypothetical protein